MHRLARRTGQHKPAPARSPAKPFFDPKPARVLQWELQALTKTIEKRSPPSIWSFFTLPRQHARLSLGEALHKSGISVAEFRRWQTIFDTRRFDQAATPLEASVPGVEDGTPPSTSSHVGNPPTWIVVALCFKARSSPEVQRAARLAITHLPHAKPEVRPSLLIVLAHMLAIHRVLPPLERVVRIFLGLPLYDESWQFNLLLRTLARPVTGSHDIGRFMARLCVLLLNAMTERQLTLMPRTYRLLLGNRYVVVELAQTLRERMVQKGVTPDHNYLESFLKLFTETGAIHDSTAYSNAIRDMAKGRDVPPHLEGGRQDQSFSKAAAFQYLTHLASEDSWKTRVDATAEWRRRRLGERSLRFVSKDHMTSAAWSARFFSLSRTSSMSPRALVDFFEWSRRQKYPFRTATTLTYTILLNSLHRKGDHELALKVWDQYTRSGLRLDRVALSAGLEVLTNAGYPQRAFRLLDKAYWGKQKGPEALEKRRIVTREGSLATSVVNSFMRALTESGRPDAALRLWDHMHMLYGTKPDAMTLTHMLTAARLASHSFESISSAFRELGFINPFQKAEGPDKSHHKSLASARQDAWLELKQRLGTNAKGTDIWGGEVAWRRARHIFRHILFTNWPGLSRVAAPARAVRASSDDVAESPFLDLRRFLAPTLSAQLPQPAPLSLTPADRLGARGMHPEIFPTDATFRAYIVLLGCQRHAGEIPLAIAWMRALEVRPDVPTLALALVFWAEVSVGAPLVESWGGRSEYGRLREWIMDWVGVDGAPTDKDIGDAMRAVHALRGGQSEPV
ncbi:hypothetical protein BV25DRAFT_648856 [Artomyces pyxidatus]|uniref:Uncharacterized protein n=1 Tax=Artomyces pyxidatus TaxID=48021 RepID=A0ACB8T1N8_9AGAM|nr:hypothetical protein BV25DRAFT_648856 [Artomyces pyxidatus]